MTTRVVGVYDADGGLRGELAYVIGRARGTAHCALCDITHGRLRRRSAFDRACNGLPVDLELVHRDELEPAVAAALAGSLPCVAAIDGDRVDVLLGPRDLEACAGDPEDFAARLVQALDERS